MNILITGASGFLGTALMGRLGRSFTVKGLSHNQDTTDCAKVDLRRETEVRKALEQWDPDLIVHSAAYRDPDFCEKNPEETRRLNVDATAHLLDHAPRKTRMIYISTDYVFAGDDPPYAEDDARHPINVYGQTKLESEDLALGREDTAVLRIPLLIGEGTTRAESGFIGKTMTAVSSGRELQIDDLGLRFPTWIGDVAEVVALLIEREAAGVFHFSSSEAGTKYYWTCEIARMMGLPSDQIKPVRTPGIEVAQRPPNSQLSTEKLRSLGFSHFTDFADVVRSVLTLPV